MLDKKTISKIDLFNARGRGSVELLPRAFVNDLNGNEDCHLEQERKLCSCSKVSFSNDSYGS